MTTTKFGPKSAIEIPTIYFSKLHPAAKMPVRMTEGSAGLDVSALLLSETGRPNKLAIPPYNCRLVPTGLLVEPPPGYFLFVCARSSMAAKSILLANSPGLIDPDYRGELKVLLHNASWETQWIEHEQRIAQIVTLPVVFPKTTWVSQLSESPSRGTKGFGSTGK